MNPLLLRLVLVSTCIGVASTPLTRVCGQSSPRSPADSALASTNAPGLTEIERAARYASAIPVVMHHGSADGLADAERLVARLDRLSDAVVVQQIIGHQHLLGYYRAVDNDAAIFRHASQILALAPKIAPAAREQVWKALALAYTSLAEVYGDRAQAATAVALLTRGIAGLPNAKETLEPVRARYALVGTHGAPIEARHWFNAPTGTTRFTPGGTVTVIEFSAHWCGPCRKSYPALTRLQRAYGARGLRTLLVTTTYGFFKEEKHLTPAQEATADSVYYLREHALPVQVAVYEAPPPPQDGTRSSLPPNESHYKVGGIPQIVVLDRVGVVRMIVDGWDPTNEQQLTRMVRTLLAVHAPRHTSTRNASHHSTR